MKVRQYSATTTTVHYLVDLARGVFCNWSENLQGSETDRPELESYYPNVELILNKKE
jgi:hypothetical protein